MDLFWPIYKNLEEELLNVSYNICFNDSQLKVYSIKLADILLRTVVEIEALSKKLYSDNGGTPKANDNELFFDTDCINYLDTIWDITQKIVLVTAPNFGFEKEENNVLYPLKKANKRGSSSALWARAYQAVKHNRYENISAANVKNVIHAMAALYLLNLYNKSDKEIKNGANKNDNLSFDSKIFAVQKQFMSIDLFNGKLNNVPPEVVCIEKPTDSTYNEFLKQNELDNIERLQYLLNTDEYKDFININTNIDFSKYKWAEIANYIGGDKLVHKVYKSAIKSLYIINKSQEIVLNKNQYK